MRNNEVVSKSVAGYSFAISELPSRSPPVVVVFFNSQDTNFALWLFM
jgi:hypothetical protein